VSYQGKEVIRSSQIGGVWGVIFAVLLATLRYYCCYRGIPVLARLPPPVPLAAVCDSGSSDRVRHTSAHNHSLLHGHCVHYLEQEQTAVTIYKESTPYEK
jgi:hypothetical protein